MKPFRIKMAHQLIVNYGLYRKMSVYVSDLEQNSSFQTSLPIILTVQQPHRASDEEMSAFHSPDYIQHLKNVAPRLLYDNQE